MGKLRAKADYEKLRKARISQIKARLASLGLEKSAGELRSIISASETTNTRTPVRKYEKKVYDATSLRRSSRLLGKTPDPISLPSEEKIALTEPIRRRLLKEIGKDEIRPANAPLLRSKTSQVQIPNYVLARRCDSKSRGSVYDPVLGICCHFCRQKKLCCEEHCKRCGNGDLNEPCKGKTNCSVCHSSLGVLCRACLKVRYGEEMDEVRQNKNWMCPHCIEAKGIKTEQLSLFEEAKDCTHWNSHI